MARGASHHLVFMDNCPSQKQSPRGALQKRRSQKFRKIDRKTPVPESPFLIKLQAQACNFILKKRLWHRCFPVNFAKFLRTPFLQNTSGRLLLPTISHTFLALSTQWVSSSPSRKWRRGASPRFHLIVYCLVFGVSKEN